MTGVVLVLILAAILTVLLRNPMPTEPIPARMARSAATTGRLGDVAVVMLAAGNRGPFVMCTCPDQEVLFAGKLDDCREFAHTYNSEVRRLWEGAITDEA